MKKVIVAPDRPAGAGAGGGGAGARAAVRATRHHRLLRSSQGGSTRTQSAAGSCHRRLAPRASEHSSSPGPSPQAAATTGKAEGGASPRSGAWVGAGAASRGARRLSDLSTDKAMETRAPGPRNRNPPPPCPVPRIWRATGCPHLTKNPPHRAAAPPHLRPAQAPRPRWAVRRGALPGHRRRDRPGLSHPRAISSPTPHHSTATLSARAARSFSPRALLPLAILGRRVTPGRPRAHPPNRAGERRPGGREVHHAAPDGRSPGALGLPPARSRILPPAASRRLMPPAARRAASAGARGVRRRRRASPLRVRGGARARGADPSAPPCFPPPPSPPALSPRPPAPSKHPTSAPLNPPPPQVAERAQRLGIGGADVLVLTEPCVEKVLAEIAEARGFRAPVSFLPSSCFACRFLQPVGRRGRSSFRSLRGPFGRRASPRPNARAGGPAHGDRGLDLNSLPR